jgi:hypothetical protein
MTLFRTQQGLKTYFREKINRIGQCNSVKTTYPVDFSDFCEVFQRHPDYPEKFIGFTDIQIKYSLVFGNQLVVYIKKDNGTLEDVSVLNHCITSKSKNNLKIAMRVAIQPQIDEYKLHCLQYCELCNSHDKLEVDHHSEKAPFAKLYLDFMKHNTIPIPSSFDDTKSHMKCFQITDVEFSKSWIEFHKEHAMLRILCKKCNASQPKYIQMHCQNPQKNKSLDFK